MRWPYDHLKNDLSYQLPFQVAPTNNDVYPTDTFPSTSLQLPGTAPLPLPSDYRVDNACYFPNSMLPPSYTTTSAGDCFIGPPNIGQWKVIEKKLFFLKIIFHQKSIA